MADDWKWYASTDEETYTVGPFDTREQVVAEARALFDRRFHIVEAIKGDVSSLMPNARQIIEGELERAADDGAFGEDGDYSLCGKPDEHVMAFRELDAVLEAWFRNWRHLFPTPWTFSKTRNGEWIEPEPAEAAA